MFLEMQALRFLSSAYEASFCRKGVKTRMADQMLNVLG